VSYRVEFHASALAQLQGLPSSAFDALVERVSELVDAPWETQTLDRDEPSFRQCIFGGLGLLSFHVDDDRELIRIFDVTWIG
jgi:mRNA-degrading endonuclease RelE of RelBE toxin-antitoxin system